MPAFATQALRAMAKVEEDGLADSFIEAIVACHDAHLTVSIYRQSLESLGVPTLLCLSSSKTSANSS